MNLDEYVKTIEKLKGNYEATGDVMGNTGKKQAYGRQKKESQPVKPLSLKFDNVSGGYSYDPNQSFFSPQNALASLGGDQEVREFKAKQAKEDAAYNLKRERRGWLGNAAADTVGALAKGAANAVKGIGYAANLVGEGVSRVFNPNMSDFERERTSNFSKEYREDWSEKFDDFGNKVDKGLVSNPEKMTGAGKFFYETAQSIPTVIAGLPTLMASAAGSGMEKAETEGATPGQALLYGALAGGTEGALEHALGVVPGLRNLKNVTKGGIKGFLKTAAGEALEEALMPAIENAYAKAIYNPDQKIFNPQEMLRGGLSGAAMTAMLAPFGLGGGNTDAATSAQKGIKILPSKAAEKPQTVQTGTNTPGQVEASTGQTTTYQAATASPGTATMNINIPPTGPAQPGGLPPPANKVVMDSPKKKLSIKEAFKKAYTNVVDTLQPIVDFSKKAGDKTSVLASNTRNVGGTVDFIFTEALTDRQGNKIGKSLKEVVGNIPEGQEEAFWMYMSQRHNIDRAREGKNVISNYDSNMSAQAVAQIEAANPNFKAIGDEITTWIDTFMQEWGVNAGIIDSQVYSDLRNMYKSYFPTQREFSQLEKSMPENVRKQFVDNASPIKTATGSARDINNPVENIMNLVNRTVRTARYNDVGRSILDSVRKDPAGLKSYAEIVTGPSNTDNVISVLENGKTVYLQINDKALLDSLKGLPKVINNAKAMRWVTNKFKGLITQKNPFFALRNIFRDIPTAYTYGSEANPLKFGRDLLRAAKDIATNSDRYQRYKAVGGGMSNFFQGNAQTAAKKLIQKGFHPLKAIENFNNITETAPRLAEFNRVFDKTGDVQQALDAANNVTVNFARGGNITKQAEAFVPYLNAGVQGLDRFFKAFKDPRTALMTLAKGGIMITAPEIILYLINRDREEYKQLDNRTKDMYYLIPTGDTFIKIPKARELGVLFGSLFQRIMRTIDGDQDSFKGFGNTLATSFAPTNPLENNILSPAFMNIPKNKDFAGRNIVPQGMIMDKRSPYLQYDERTSELAKMIGALANEIAPGGISPKHIDYLIDAYTGIIGDILLPAATKGGNILKPITSQFTADPLYSNQTIQDFYELYDKAQQRATDKNVSENISGKIVTPEEKLRNGLQKAAEEIADLNKKKKQYEAVGNTNAVRLVQQQIIDTAKAAIEKYR